MISKFKKQLRINQTNVEQLLWKHLRGRRFQGWKFRRQHSFENYIVDFVCLEKKVIIELDGGQHSKQISYDQKRTAFLEGLGYTVLRFWNDELINNLESVLLMILSTPHPPFGRPLPQGERYCSQAMILAAGMGKRLQPLTLTTPKPLIELHGKPLIQHTLDRLKSIPKIVVNTHYLADQIHTYLADKDVIISHEDSLLETGGGILNALPHFTNDPILCLNSDIWWQEDHGNILDDLTVAWDDSTMDVLLVLVPKENALNFSGPGDFTWDDKTQIPTFRESDSAPYVYTGIQLLHPRAFIGEKPRCFSLVEIYKKATKQNRLKAIVLNGKWSDVGTPQALEKLREMEMPTREKNVERREEI